MKNITEELKMIAEKKAMTFCEPFYKSKDEKTIMGEVPFKEILFLEYRDTEAGSNPREYYGLKKVNKAILKSILKDSTDMFRFLHSGIIVSMTNATKKSDNINIEYDECCLTNGNQTRFLILILTILKLKFDNNNQLNSLQQKEYNAFIKKTFGNCVAIKSILEYIRFNKIGEILNYLIKETKYGKIFSSMSINDFLNSRIRIQINYINPILNDLENNKWNEYEAGTEIAAANNATQNVKPDDLFGNKNKKELEEYIFKNFTKQYKDSVKIEYRYGEIIDKSSEKAHILTLLRPIIATGILTKEKDIYTFTNQRAPIYIVYEKLLTKTSNAKSTIDAVAKLISLLYKIRVDYVSPTLEKHKRDLIRDYKKKAVSGELTETIINDDIRQAGSDDDKIEKIIKSNVNYNIEHILPVLIFRIRRLFIEDNNQNIKLTVEDDKVEIFLTSIIKAIYDSYVKLKLSGLPTSLTTELRSSKFYEFGFETYNALKDVYQFNETDFIEKNKHIIN